MKRILILSIIIIINLSAFTVSRAQLSVHYDFISMIIKMISDSSLINQTELTAQLADTAKTFQKRSAMKDSVIAIVDDSLATKATIVQLADSVNERLKKSAFFDSLNNIHNITVHWHFNFIDTDTLIGIDSAYSALWDGIELRGQKTNTDSINILGRTAPYSLVKLANWFTEYDWTDGDADTMQIEMRLDSIAANTIYPSLRASNTDTSAVLNILDAFFFEEVREGYVGADSISGWYKTDCGSVDTNYVKISVYKFSEGDTVFCDSTTVLANTSWTRFVLKGAGLAKITRWDNFLLHSKFASFMITRRAILAGVRIYWKEGS